MHIFPGLSARLQSWLFPWPVATLALLAALGVASEHRSVEHQREEALELLDPRLASWLPEISVRDLERERDPSWIRLRLARSRVAAEMDPAFVAASEGAGGPSGEQRETPEAPEVRLQHAADLASDVLVERPSAWQAAMLLGAATYLGRSHARDPRLFTAYREWEAPLQLALSLAPTKPEPRRFLALAYLELWPSVSEEKRQVARGLIEEAFRDPGIFHRLAGIWLAVVTEREEAFAPIPPEPAAWRHVGTLLAREREWSSYVEARRRLRAAEEIRGRTLLAEAELRARGGDVAGSRDLLLRALTLGTPDMAGVAHLAETLRRLPPGPVGSQADALRDWLLWSLELCLYGPCPLPVSALERLTGLASELEPADQALAALMVGRLPEAERLERRSDRLWHPSWSPYLLAKARMLAGRGELEEAAAALDRVHPSWTHRAVYARVAQEVHLAPAALPAPRGAGATWPAAAWRPATESGEIAARRSDTGDVDRLDLWLAEEVPGVRLTLAGVPAEGAVVELRLDGRVLVLSALDRRDGNGSREEVVEARASIPAGLHLLEVETVAGERVHPGELRTLPRTPTP